MSDDEIKGVIYFSNGSDLIKYDFASKKKEILFRYREESELGKKITHIKYPVYLKNRNKILFIGLNINKGSDHIFESDLNLKNWKEYQNMEDVRVLSLSPDERMIAYYRHPNKLVIKKYEDLEKDGDNERIIADSLFNGSRPLWLSNTELVYDSIDNNIVKIDMQSGAQQILIKDAFCSSVTPSARYILAFSSDNKASYIYLYDLDSSQGKAIIRGSRQQVSSPEICSPDGKYFLFTKLRLLSFTFNIRKLWNNLVASLEERHDLYLYSLATGEEWKVIEDEITFGGFWLENNSG